MTTFRITPTAIVRRDGKRRVDITAAPEKPMNLTLEVRDIDGGKNPVVRADFSLSGCFDEEYPSTASLWLDLPKKDFSSVWVVFDKSGEKLAEIPLEYKKPREWTMYMMISSHTDIGLHNSQYIQRFNSSRFTDLAMELCDKTEDRPAESRYRYTMEGSWFFSNFAADRGKDSLERLLNDYIKEGKIGVCAGAAGNHTQTYNLEETCRSAYSKKWLAAQGVSVRTMTMIDNNGISPAIIQPYADAGIENIIFAPNQWNPLPSTIWKCDRRITGYTWNPDSDGGGARVDVRWNSNLPMLFRWRGAGGRELLVWASTQYDRGGLAFGLESQGGDVSTMEDRVAEQMRLIEKRYPYDIWLFENYCDDQSPDLKLCNTITEWNRRYKYPQFRTLGAPDEPFDIIRERFYDKVPVLSGDITGGWYQHPLAATDFLSDKLEAGRRLETAEKLASVSSLLTDYSYPETRFNLAYSALVMNDEHSYGTSGYQGRRVYETWMQHRDWIDKARAVADEETASAALSLSREISGSGERVIVFNPTALEREEIIDTEFGKCRAALPPFGWKTLYRGDFAQAQETAAKQPSESKPPVVENRFYIVRFAENGSVSDVFDKSLGRSINSANLNEFLYTRDINKTFTKPEPARFEVSRDSFGSTVTAYSDENISGAEIISRYFLPEHEKRIDIDNSISHLRDMFNSDRYKRYAYIAFPFDVPDCRRICDLGGIDAEYGKDVTGHGTDVYMAAHEYCAVDSANGDFGVGLVGLDGGLVEFDHIHPDKTAYGDAGKGSELFVYIANDWLQMHAAGGSSLNYRFRYTITSYEKDYLTAGLPALAERISAPPAVIALKSESVGTLPETMSLMKTDERLVALKLAADRKSLIARIHTRKIVKKDAVANLLATNIGKVCLRAIDEEDYRGADELTGFITMSISAGRNLAVRAEKEPEPLEIGGFASGLITAPRAIRGEENGMLYLLWGKPMSDSLSHYELYRSDKEGFTPDSETFLSEVKPEEYIEGRYIDKGLQDNRRYFYRVRAVSESGEKGAFSEEFSALTKES